MVSKCQREQEPPVSFRGDKKRGKFTSSSSKPELDSGTFDFRERDRISYNFSLLFCLFIDLKSTRQWHHGHHGTLCTKSFALIHELHQKKKKKKTNVHWLLLFFSFQIQMEMG